VLLSLLPAVSVIADGDGKAGDGNGRERMGIQLMLLLLTHIPSLALQLLRFHLGF